MSEQSERETRILDAAAELIRHYGYDKTTVSDIAHRAGVSKGAIYLHFSSKDELFEALLRRELTSYSVAWMRRIEADPQGGTIAGIYRNVLFALRDHPFVGTLLSQDERVLGNYLRKPDNLLRQGGTGLRAEFIQAMQEAGNVRADVDPQVVAIIMSIFSVGIVSLDQITDDPPEMEALIEAMGDFMDRALRPESGGDSEAGKQVLRNMMQSARAHLQLEDDTTETN